MFSQNRLTQYIGQPVRFCGHAKARRAGHVRNWVRNGKFRTFPVRFPNFANMVATIVVCALGSPRGRSTGVNIDFFSVFCVRRFRPRRKSAPENVYSENKCKRRRGKNSGGLIKSWRFPWTNSSGGFRGFSGRRGKCL